MPEGLRGIAQLAWLRRLVRGLGLSVLVTFGSGAGWQAGRWHDTPLSIRNILATAESVAAPGPPGPRTSAEPAEAEPMPEPVAEAEPELAAPKLDHAATALLEATPGETPSAQSDTALRVVSDPRDRSVVPPLAPSDGELARGADATPVAQPALERSGGPGRPVAASPQTPASYVVAPGDTLGSIAARYGVNVEWVRLANDLPNASLLQVGQSLQVPTSGGPVHLVRPGETVSQIAAAYGVDPETVASANELDGDLLLMPGQRLLIPGGVPPVATPVAADPTPAPRVQPAPTSTARPVSAAAAAPTPSATPVRPAPTAAPVEARAAPRTPTSPPASAPATAAVHAASLNVPGGPLSWPLGGAITQRFGENGHSGLDIAGPIGAPVKSAAPGTVVVAAKLSTGYGWRIMIDHGGGYSSLYAHLSAFSVAEGDRVARGQVIGAVGATGIATGPHLHFEMRVNGQPNDPLKFLP